MTLQQMPLGLLEIQFEETYNTYMRTENQVRDTSAIILGFNDGEDNVQQGTGQITTFNQLGFRGKIDKPDGWYLPKDKSKVAIILEAKAEDVDIDKDNWVDEIKKNMEIAHTKYERVIGILYNGQDIRIFKDNEEITGIASTLQHKSYYLSLYNQEKIDKQKIYNLTKQINNCLNFKFGIGNLYHRMIFTACALVAKRYGALLVKGMDFATMKSSIINTLKGELSKELQVNMKLSILTDVYSDIQMNIDNDQEAIDDFIEWVAEISRCVNSDNWNGEDVMGIFFNEFNRYKRKSEKGQIFTPDHITSFMYRLIDVHKDDRVLDATCGSGAFLVKAMCNMIKEAGGINSQEAKDIKKLQLFGIELERDIYALACANMLIHKDGKTNLLQTNAASEEAAEWIKSKGITKVLMNPPYEKKYGCMQIVQNVLNSVPVGTQCAFILPDKKLEKDFVDKKYGNKLLRRHRLTTIVKMPENLFNAGVITSVYVFIAGKPQDNNKIIGYYIEEDGLETVKNQGRQDIRNRWQAIEDYWIDAIKTGVEDRFNTRQVIDPHEHLSYQMPETPFEITEEDFMKTIMDYEMFMRGIDVKEFNEKLLNKVLYSSTIQDHEELTSIVINKQQ